MTRVSDIGVDSAICIWDYEHLPQEIKDFMRDESISTDDADWFALRPNIYADDYIPWLEEPQFGCCLVQEYVIGTIGYTLIVGYHA